MICRLGRVGFIGAVAALTIAGCGGGGGDNDGPPDETPITLQIAVDGVPSSARSLRITASQNGSTVTRNVLKSEANTYSIDAQDRTGGAFTVTVAAYVGDVTTGPGGTKLAEGTSSVPVANPTGTVGLGANLATSDDLAITASKLELTAGENPAEFADLTATLGGVPLAASDVTFTISDVPNNLATFDGTRLTATTSDYSGEPQTVTVTATYDDKPTVTKTVVVTLAPNTGSAGGGVRGGHR